MAQVPTPVAVNQSGLQQPARAGRWVPAAGSGRARVGWRGKMWPSAQGADTARAGSARLAPPALGHSTALLAQPRQGQSRERRCALWAWRCMRRRSEVGG